MDTTLCFSDWQQRATQALDKCLPDEKLQPRRLHQAIRYSVLSGGKRIRPLLVYATGTTFNCELKRLDTCACACELIHAYSLIHDDLPAMDDDDLRRGKATCHIEFDESTAILAGDALQSLAFQLLADNNDSNLSPDKHLALIKLLAHASGSIGMVGGQSLDLSFENDQQISQSDIEQMYRLKTGALIKASIEMPMIIAEVDARTQQQLSRFADNLGLAFQIQDDILDIEVSSDKLGKTQGSDLQNNKATYPKIVGIDTAKDKVNTLIKQAKEILHRIDESDSPLARLTHYLLNREY